MSRMPTSKPFPNNRHSSGWLKISSLLAGFGLCVGSMATAQILPPIAATAKPVSSPVESTLPALPSDQPIAKLASAVVNEKPNSSVVKSASREAELEARIKELEQAAAERTAREVSLEQRLKSIESMMATRASATVSSVGTQVPGRVGAIDPPAGEEALVPSGVNGGNLAPSLNPSLPGSNLPDDAVPGYDVIDTPQGLPASTLASAASSAAKKPDMPFSPKLNKGYAGVGPGFVISSEDDEFQLQFHNLTQVELRQYNNQNMNPTHSTFGIPRQWLIFNGRLSKPIEYFVATNWGFTNLNLLDTFINIHYDDRLQLKLGRFKTPYTYEFYAEPVNGLINPERSMFFNNYGPNRDVGAMFWGQVFNKTTDYAVGVFNGVRNGNIDNNNAKDIIAYFNSRPLEKSGSDLFKYWNVGGSTSYNVYNGTARPEVFRTNVPYPGDPNVSPQWLILNPNTQSFGSQKLWSVHSAWFYKSLSLIGEWNSGYETYAKTSSLMKGTHVPTNGWYLQAGYFLTGEQVTSRGVVQPLHPFNPKGKDGLGAFELGFRWAEQSLDKSIFGFASDKKWTNDTNVVDLGLNWYWNSNVKFYIGWQRAMFGQPIQAAPGLTPSASPSYWMSSSDMLWLRAQLYY
jgi:phosphate-selective porin OprO/OprP